MTCKDVRKYRPLLEAIYRGEHKAIYYDVLPVGISVHDRLPYDWLHSIARMETGVRALIAQGRFVVTRPTYSRIKPALVRLAVAEDIEAFRSTCCRHNKKAVLVIDAQLSFAARIKVAVCQSRAKLL